MTQPPNDPNLDEELEKQETPPPKKNKIEALKEKLFSSFSKDNLIKIFKRLNTTSGIISIAVTVLLLGLIFFIVQSCTPKKGTILYGICGSFLEQQLTFPETISHTWVEQYRKAVRIYYSHLDAFGEYQVEMIECAFVQDPQKGVQLESVFFNYVKEITSAERVPGKGRLYKVEQKHIDLFNRSMSPAAILKNNPNLELPPYWAVY